MSIQDIYGEKIVVCDTSSAYVKAAVVDGKDVTVPNVVGRYKRRGAMSSSSSGNDYQDWVVGQEALDKEAMLSLTYPIKRGIIVNLDDMKKVWRHVFDKLQTTTKDCAIIITEPAGLDNDMRKSMVEAMFELFEFRSILVAASLVLTLHGSTRKEKCTGIGVEIGHGLTQIVPVVEGARVGSEIRIGNVSSDDIAVTLAQLLATRYHEFDQPDNKKYVNNIKERFSYVALRPTEEDAKVETHEHLDFPSVVTLTSERYQCLETLFDPVSGGGIVELIMSAANTANLTSLKDIEIGGGTSSAKGFVVRMTAELEACF